LDPHFRFLGPGRALETKGPRDDGNRKDPQFLCDFRHNWRSPCSGPSAHPRGDEHHVCTLEDVGDVLSGFLRGFFPDFRIAASTEPAGEAGAELKMLMGLNKGENLDVGVHGHEFHAPQSRAEHAVHGVSPAATHPYHQNPCRTLPIHHPPRKNCRNHPNNRAIRPLVRRACMPRTKSFPSTANFKSPTPVAKIGDSTISWNPWISLGTLPRRTGMP